MAPFLNIINKCLVLALKIFAPPFNNIFPTFSERAEHKQYKTGAPEKRAGMLSRIQKAESIKNRKAVKMTISLNH